MRQLLLNSADTQNSPSQTEGEFFSIYSIRFQESASSVSRFSIFPIRLSVSACELSRQRHASHSSSISYTAFPSMTSLVFMLPRSCLPFFFEAAVQTVTRSLLYGILSYTLYYARQPQHDMNRPRIYCFKKNKDPFHDGKE